MLAGIEVLFWLSLVQGSGVISSLMIRGFVFCSPIYMEDVWDSRACMGGRVYV